MKNEKNSSKNKREEVSRGTTSKQESHLSKKEIEERLARLQIAKEEIDDLEEKLIKKYGKTINNHI